jgi:hypothetical protein
VHTVWVDRPWIPGLRPEPQDELDGKNRGNSKKSARSWPERRTGRYLDASDRFGSPVGSIRRPSTGLYRGLSRIELKAAEW